MGHGAWAAGRAVCVWLLFLLAISPMTLASVDGFPSFDIQSDTGIYVWRTWGGRWQMRVLAASGDQRVSGAFQAGHRFVSSKRLALEWNDRLRESSEHTVHFDLQTARRTIDGLAFDAGDGHVCLRTSSKLPIYLGRNSTPASAPVPLTGPAACATAMPLQTGLVVERKSKFDWEVRLASSGGRARFDGKFELSQPPVSYVPVSLEGNDSLAQPNPSTLAVHMEAWPGGYDGLDFTTVEFDSICLRSTSGSEQVISLLSKGQAKPLRVTTPVDLTNNGSCGLPADPFPPPAYRRKFNAGHYVQLTPRDDDVTLGESVLPGVKGFVKRYSWRTMEPTLGNYDFSAIERDLATVAQYGLQLVALIEDKTFVDRLPTPEYLRDRTLPNRPGGYTVARWDPYVVSRYKALITALGRRFDSNRHFEGIATEESALGLNKPELDAWSYTPEKYREALVEQLSHAARSLPTSRVFWFMNFLVDGNWYMGEILRRVAPLGVVVGGPDVLPDSLPLQKQTYPHYDGAVGNMPSFGQIEPVCYHAPHEDPTYPTTYWTPTELFEYARDELHVSYMFWLRWRWRLYPDSYNWWDAIPVIESNPTFNR